MALRLLDATALIHRLTNITNGDMACCMWARFSPVITGANFGTAFATISAGYAAYAGLYYYLFDGVDDNTFTVDVDNGGGAAPVGALHVINVARKVHLAYRRSGTSHFFYVNGQLVGSKTKDMSAVTLNELFIGNDGFSQVAPAVEIWDYKEWNTSKSVGVIQSEMRALGSVESTSGLHVYAPLVTDLNDDSGNGNHFVGAGNYDFVTDPALPTNLSPATALDLPFESTTTYVNQNLEPSFVSMYLYYKYTNDTGHDVVLSIAHWGDLTASGAGYNPHADGWVTEDLSNSNVYDGFINGSATFPLPAGMTIWFEFKPDDALDTPFAASVLHIKTLRGPEDAPQNGDVFIRAASFSAGPDLEEVPEYTGLQAGIIRAEHSAIVGYAPLFVTGESGDVFPDTGRMIFGDEGGSLDGFPDPDPLFAYYFHIFSPEWSEATRSFPRIARVAFESPTLPPINRMHLPSNKAYLLGRHPATGIRYATVTADGVKSADQVITSVGSVPQALAVNDAETIMYLAPFSGAIKRWDLVGGAYLSDLAAAVAGYRITDMLVMAGDSVIVNYWKSSAPRDSFVRRYSAAGTVLNTYAPTFSTGLGGTAPRLGYSWDDVPSFWFFNHLATSYSDVRKIRISNGDELEVSITADVIQSEIEQSDPPIPYTSDSCPVLELLGIPTTSPGGNAIIGPLVFWHHPRELQ